ncbi:hypothetical protein AMTRI_Chr01g128720 [Amborella trichopoda]
MLAPQEHLQAFESSISNGLDRLSPSSNASNIHSLAWLNNALDLLLTIHGGLKTLISEIDVPIKRWSSKTLDQYLNQTLEILDLLNSLSSRLSEIESSHLKILGTMDSGETLTSPATFSGDPLVFPVMFTGDSPAEPELCEGERVLIRAFYELKVLTFLVIGAWGTYTCRKTSHMCAIDLLSRDFSWGEAAEKILTCKSGLKAGGGGVASLVWDLDAGTCKKESSKNRLEEMRRVLDFATCRVRRYFDDIMRVRTDVLDVIRTCESH